MTGVSWFRPGFVLLLLQQQSPCCLAWQNLFPPWPATKNSSSNRLSSAASSKRLEDALIAAIAAHSDRDDESNIQAMIEKLEQSPFSLPEPAIAPQVYGVWRLLHTTSFADASTSSPIQRRAVNSKQFPIYQDIVVVAASNEETTTTTDQQLVVKQVVKFSSDIVLSVDALASTTAFPLAELQQARQSTGKVLGMNILGVSLVGTEAQPNPERPNSRIDFVFDEGNFYFGGTESGWKIPYPVPFRLPLFRDWVKGWIDITYLSNRLRISRGNKGTTFVLVKEEDSGVE